MTVQGQIVVSILAVIGLIWILRLISDRKLSLESGLLWIAIMVGAIILMAFPGLLRLITDAVGAKFEVSAITLLALAFFLALSVNFSIRISVLSRRLTELSRYVALLEYKLDTQSVLHFTGEGKVGLAAEEARE
jgi:hypothetical protein